MPSWATLLSSSLVAGRASRAVARKRSRPASQALTMASRWGGTPVESSHCTRVTTARAMWRAMPARRRSSWETRAGGRVEETLGADLDAGASLAMVATIRSHLVIGHFDQGDPYGAISRTLTTGIPQALSCAF